MQKFSQTLMGGGGVTPALKGFTLFSCSSLIFTGLLTVDLNAQTITITNNNRFINNGYHGKTLIVNSHLNTGNYSGIKASLGLYFTTIKKLDIQQNASIESWLDTQSTTINQVDISSKNVAGFHFKGGTKIGTIDIKKEGRMQTMYIRNGNVTIDTLNIEGTLAGWSAYGSINNQGGKINTINVKQGGKIEQGIRNNNGTIQTLTIQGQVQGGVHNNRNGKINTITVQGGSIQGGVRNNNNGTIQTLTINSGTINGGITNNRTMGSISVSDSTVNGGINNNNSKINNGINITNSTINGSIVNSGTNASTGAINITGTSSVSGSIVNQNGATFNSQITLEKDSKLGGISNAQGSTMGGTLTLNGEVGTISNSGTFNSTLTLNNEVGTISNSGTFNSTLTLNNEVGTISNAGTFNSTLTLSNKVGTIENKQGGTISNDITINSGGSVGAINNLGTMQNITNNGTLSHITNSGTMKVITNSSTVTLTLTNSGGTIDKVTNATGATATIHNTGTINNEIENKGTATIHNQGTITKGIINDGGTLTVVNDFRRTEGIKDFQTIGKIGKTAKGVHIENNKNGKLNIPIWYFNKEEYTTAEERKNKALLVDGDYANISLENAFVSTHNLDVDETYDAYSLIADKDGNRVGDKINNGQGIDINKLYSVSGIYSFENYGGKGRYRAIINRDELSGRTLAQSIIYSQRVRNVNLSRM
ncbi:hypothetical protein, partial [Campylobacter upsaliensis]|uniref:hypothetical protein n=1 Tax=Campylobacter upsaliensis TaxID=28080 RepID=UPI0022EAD42C